MKIKLLKNKMKILKQSSGLIRKLSVISLLLTVLVSCSLGKEKIVEINTISECGYCDFYTPLPYDLPEDVATYWKNQNEIISKKEDTGETKTPLEKLLYILIQNSTANYEKFAELNCPYVE